MTIPLEIIDLSKTYDTKEAVRNISFKVNENEIIGILGPNGCGKTTTIGMILGLLKPTDGKVLINGLEIESQRVDLLNNLKPVQPIQPLLKKQKNQKNQINKFSNQKLSKFSIGIHNINCKVEKCFRKFCQFGNAVG